MSTVRDIVLEVKRRLGDVNSPVPSEIDVLAVINRVLLGLHNYGVLVNADVLQTTKVVTCDAANKAEFTDGISSILSVVDPENGREIPAVSPVDGAKMSAKHYGFTSAFSADDNSITVYPIDVACGDLVVVYIPAFSKVLLRSEKAPFCPALENAIIEGCVKVLRGEVQTLSDTEFVASIPFSNMIMQYFRGIAHTEIRGRAPW